MLDGDSFPEWNPLYKYFRVVKGNFDNFYETIPNAAQIVVKTEVTILDSKATLQVIHNTPQRIVWTSVVLVGWIMLATITHDFRFDPNKNTTVYLREEGYTGCIAGLTMYLIRPALQEKADRMLVNLKARVEQ